MRVGDDGGAGGRVGAALTRLTALMLLVRKAWIACLWLSCCCLLGSPVVVLAQPPQPHVSLAWQVPAVAGCATRPEFEARVARITRHRFAADAAAPSHDILAQVWRVPDGGFAARVSLTEASGKLLGTRDLRHPSPNCRALDVSLGVIVATLLDRVHVDHASAETGSRAGRIAIGWFASGGMAPGSRPWLGTGLEVGLPFQLPIVLDASTYLPGELVDAQGRGARLWSFHGGLNACPRLFGEALQLHLCVGTQVGGLWARGIGLSDNQAALRPLWSLDLEPKLLLRVAEGVLARLSLAATWMPIRPRIHWEIEGEGERTARGQPFLLILRFGIIGMGPRWP